MGGGTGATLDGSILETTAEGTVTVTATIAKGKSDTEDYTKGFTIETVVNPGSGNIIINPLPPLP